MSNELNQQLLQHVIATAHATGVDPEKFNPAFRDVIRETADFLARPQQNEPDNRVWPLRRAASPPESAESVAPLILCGRPGTGKTTFLYVLDIVLRSQLALPDNIRPKMAKRDNLIHTVAKRRHAGHDLSLLSVRAWSDLLHFYAWDRQRHRFVQRDQDVFVRKNLRPMRVILADEVEMTGYSPTLPDIAKQGILVIGTSNEHNFRQLDQAELPAKIFKFEGDDMRAGDPADAVVSAADPLSADFDAAATAQTHKFEALGYRSLQRNSVALTHFEFPALANAPLLESMWLKLLTAGYAAATDGAPLRPGVDYVLLLDNFSLERLRTDYNAIIRFVSFFDAIEQLGIGVLVRNNSAETDMSREAINHMKVTIHTARGIPEPIKRKTVVGIDRLISRIGQAGIRARTLRTTPQGS